MNKEKDRLIYHEKEMEASQHFMSKNAKSMFDVIDMCKYYETEENTVRQTNRQYEGSFVNLLNQEMEELKNSMKKENDRYLDCKYLDAGMDGMLCSKTFCTTCKEFNGEKCSDYISKNKKKKITKTTDWLTKGMTQEEIKKIKEEAIREADKELAQVEEREKQVEEMATCEKCVHKELCFNQVGICENYTKEIVKKNGCKYYQPKLPEDSVVLSKEEQDKLYQKGFDDGKEFAEKFYKPLVKAQTRTETAEKYFDMILDVIKELKSFETIDIKDIIFLQEKNKEILKQLGVELKE